MLLKTIKLKKIYYILIIFAIVIFLLIFFLYKIVLANDNTEGSEKDYIKWIDFNATEKILQDTSKLDITSHNENSEIKYNWIELLAYLSSKYYGHLDSYKKADLEKLVNELNNGKTMKELSKNMPNYEYYLESYSAILGGFIGNYEIKNPETRYVREKIWLKSLFSNCKRLQLQPL